MKRVLIHETDIKGHRLEYIHHLYNKAREYTKTEFIFAVPEDFNQVKNKLEWKESSNISFHISESLESKDNLIIDSFIKSKQLRFIIKQYKIDTVFTISLIQYLPMLPFLISNKIKVSGIIYMIYLYNWKESSAFRKMQDAMKYYILSKMKVFKNVFMLNDAASARYLNCKFKTDKFKFLPDPFVPIPSEDIKDLREELNIEENKTVFLHFGGLTRVKGTIDILDAIELLNQNELNDKCFIFAGRVYDDIKDEFYRKLEILRDKVQIIVYDEFCDYSFLGSLCMTTDFILIPYKRTSNSSGLIGYAAQFGKPVIAPQEKFLGKLVRKYNLGITIADTKPETIAQEIKKVYENKRDKLFSSKYIEENNVSSFTKVIFKDLENN